MNLEQRILGRIHQRYLNLFSTSLIGAEVAKAYEYVKWYPADNPIVRVITALHIDEIPRHSEFFNYYGADVLTGAALYYLQRLARIRPSIAAAATIGVLGLYEATKMQMSPGLADMGFVAEWQNFTAYSIGAIGALGLDKYLDWRKKNQLDINVDSNLSS